MIFSQYNLNSMAARIRALEGDAKHEMHPVERDIMRALNEARHDTAINNNLVHSVLIELARAVMVLAHGERHEAIDIVREAAVEILNEMAPDWREGGQ